MDGRTANTLKQLLGLEREPVALRWSTRIPKGVPRVEKKHRFCAKLAQAARGLSFYSTADEEECMGGARYCGMRDASRFPTGRRSGEFLVARGIYKNVAAVQRAWRKNMAVEAGIFKALLFAPLASAPFEPDVVFVLCNGRQGMELLHANAYDSGKRAIGADAGPICSSMAAIPYLTGRVTYGFGDVGSRSYMDLAPGDVMVSIPGSELERLVANLKEMRSKGAFGE